ncbi:MAG: TM0106 family RecB-like putative nuclease [Actinobacteria bacterium]|nr:MAG: TM0106 family RecB-like putative nuclease [Actinomycetota bacterium]
MQRTGDGLLLSATDLVAFLECEHLSALDLRVTTGQEVIKQTRTDSTELVARKGSEHEQRYLESLISKPLDIVTIPSSIDGAAAASEAAAATEAAMRAGTDVIYQAALADGAWRGYADFLERVAKPSPAFGDWSYEVVDTKLARRSKPEFIVQLCLYSDLLARLQGLQPEHMHIVLGTGERESFRLQEFAAFYRRLLGRYEGRLAEEFAGTYPEPVAHCDLCRYSEHCKARWLADDYLTLILGVGRTRAIRLRQGGITTGAQLALAQPASRPRRIGEKAFEGLREQARLQVHERSTGEQTYGLLAPEEGRGFERLPQPRPGDLYFDMEGDPFYDGEGLEYLFGVSRLQDGEVAFRAFWAHDRAEEKRAFEEFIDFVMAARAADPELHVYHYAAYERSALKHLMGRHGTREEEVDELLREKVLVDLLDVTRQAMRTSKPSNSLKDVEAFYMREREQEVTEAGDSIVRFEEWLETGEQALLDAIEAYNEVDCLSTLKLHSWLLERRGEAKREFGVELRWRAPPEPYEQSPESKAIQDEVARLEASLLVGLPEDVAAWSEDERGRWLMAQLLNYHRREEKPAWWAYFARLEQSPEELVDDPEAIGNLAPDPESEPVADERSFIYTLRFPEQEHKLSPGGDIVDPVSEKDVDVAEIDDARGILRMRRAQNRAEEPLPAALIPGGPYRTTEQRGALRRLARATVASSIDGPGDFRALRDMLRRRPPRVAGVAPGPPLIARSPEIEQLKQLAERLDESCLFIQGPPGSGKSWTGGQLVVHLIGRGARVGVAATSHKAIHNLLEEVEDAASDQGVMFEGWKKSSGGNPESEFTSKLKGPLITNEPKLENFPPPDHVRLVAGTAWLFAPETMDSTLDYVVIDEAGQVSIADALAIGTAARNVILLGDPLQLAQVSQGTHPDGAGASVLEHLLGDGATIPPGLGVFLDHTRRMHPDVCAFISEVVYENRLEALDECAHQRINAPGALTGTGLRFIPTDHEGNTRSSVEEAEAIATAVAGLDGASVTLADGKTRRLKHDDVMVVTPYNAQVRCLTEHLPVGVRIGTVDKFQGQEAQIVFFSMATSSDADVPRNVEFLYSRNRLNVAVSRARCLAVLVCSPRLLDLKPRTVEQARLVNALCRFVEIAQGVGI